MKLDPMMKARIKKDWGWLSNDTQLEKEGIDEMHRLQRGKKSRSSNLRKRKRVKAGSRRRAAAQLISS